MQAIAALVLAAALIPAGPPPGQQGKPGAGPGLAVPGLATLPGLGNDGAEQPSWMPKPPAIGPALPRNLTAQDAMRELRDQGYYDIRPLKEAPGGFTTQARRYGKKVTVNVDKRDGFISTPEGDD